MSSESAKFAPIIPPCTNLDITSWYATVLISQGPTIDFSTCQTDSYGTITGGAGSPIRFNWSCFITSSECLIFFSIELVITCNPETGSWDITFTMSQHNGVVCVACPYEHCCTVYWHKEWTLPGDFFGVDENGNAVGTLPIEDIPIMPISSCVTLYGDPYPIGQAIITLAPPP